MHKVMCFAVVHLQSYLNLKQSQYVECFFSLSQVPQSKQNQTASPCPPDLISLHQTSLSSGATVGSSTRTRRASTSTCWAALAVIKRGRWRSTSGLDGESQGRRVTP